MRDLLLQSIPWGIQVIVAIQSATGNALDPLFQALTLLGEEYFSLFLMPAIFWCLDKRLGIRLTILLLISAYVNAALKQLFLIPRPYVISPAVIAKASPSGYAFPSGHAQTAIALWPALALSIQKRWALIPAFVLALLIALSRIYLGVHYPQDIAAGLLVGGVILALFVYLEPRVEPWIARQHPAWQIGGTITLALVLIALLPIKDAFTVSGSVAGLVTGYVLQEHWLSFRPVQGRWPLIGRLLIGLAVVALLFIGLRLILPRALNPLGEGMIRALHYAGIGIGATLIAPWLFIQAGLASSASPRSR